jgi:hypothetical protein
MMMVEGGGDGKIERRLMWQWVAALMADASIDGGIVVGCRRDGGGRRRG